MTEHFDYLIIGGGPAGYEAAAMAAENGYTTALVERDQPGGTCLNRGCIPTKCFCTTAQAAATFQHAAELGLNLPAGVVVTPDMPAIVQRKNAVVEQLRAGVEALLQQVEVISGEARFVAPKTVEAAGRTIEADRVLIATGSEPAMLPIPGADLTVTSTEVLDLEVLPDSMIIIGAGVIGMEFASIFCRLGVQVSVVEYAREVLPQFDRDVARRLRTALKQQGVDIHTQAEVKSIEAAEGDRRRVCFAERGKDLMLEAEMVLMAVGRKAVIPAGAAEVGYAIGSRGFEVNGAMLTNIAGAWAVGDCNGRCQLAHAATAQARVALGENVDLSVIPSAVFTIPECAMVGLTGEQCEQLRSAAEAEERPVPTYVEGKAFFRANGKACAMAETDGIVKVILDAETALIVGCHICGPHAADLIAEAALAMSARLTASELISTVHAHPTLSEALTAAITQAIMRI